MSKEDKIDILKEVKEQIWAQTVSNEHTGEETRVFMNVIAIIDKMIEKVRYTRQFRG